MEIQTTIREFPEAIRNMNIPSDTAIRVIICEPEKGDRKIDAKAGAKKTAAILG